MGQRSSRRIRPGPGSVRSFSRNDRKHHSLFPRERKQKRAGLKIQTGPFNLLPAMTYAPTQLPVQYHRPGEA